MAPGFCAASCAQRSLLKVEPASTCAAAIANGAQSSRAMAAPGQNRVDNLQSTWLKGSCRGPSQLLHSVSRSGSCPRAVNARQPVTAGSAVGTKLISDTKEWKELQSHVADIEKTHLRDLLRDEQRSTLCEVEHNGFFVDYARQRVTAETMKKLMALAKAANMKEKIHAMFAGDRINATENRAVLHVATRAPKGEVIKVDGVNVVPEVHEVLDKIKSFSEKVRSGEWKGATGKALKDVVCIGIGGSFLGPAFVHTALRTDHRAALAASGRRIRFLSNVDPIDVARQLNGLDPETTLVIVVSKTFTTVETMLNARTVRAWILSNISSPDAVSKHMVAVSTDLVRVKDFGIDPANAFGFWDWVGGRYSVTSAVGILPLAIQYGYDHMERFLAGCWDMDTHFRDAPFEKNIPVLLGLIGVWNTQFLQCPTRAILPYCQALAKLPSHIQQLSMESNGKGVAMDGTQLPFEAGEVEFGEPGTNGQHSFYQLIHQGRVIPCDFIGIIKSQQSVYLKNELVSNHDELMCNFFAQADALAYGKSAEELAAEGVPPSLIPHKTFTGNRPSSSILLPTLDAYTAGQLLSHYEHRVAVAGFIYGINSFDQWGVELGKVLAGQVRTTMNQARTKGVPITGYNSSTTALMNRYLSGKTKWLYPEPRDVFPVDILANGCDPNHADFGH